MSQENEIRGTLFVFRHVPELREGKELSILFREISIVVYFQIISAKVE